MAMTCAELFAARGDEWNRPNWQHDALPVVRVTERHGRVVQVELSHEIEGYGPDGTPTRALPQRRPYEPKPAPADRSAYRECNQRRTARPWTPEYRPVVPVVYCPPKGEAQTLSEDQRRLRARQRAAVKARLTRANNKLAAQEAERLDTLRALLAQIQS